MVEKAVAEPEGASEAVSMSLVSAENISLGKRMD